MRSLMMMAAGAAMMLSPGVAVGAERFPSSLDAIPRGWTDPVFKLSQDYPKSVKPERPKFLDIDFRKEPYAYAMAVRDYVYEGNTAVNFRVGENPVRTWYHAPWLHPGTYGREFAHGMTRERTSRDGELWTDPVTGAKSPRVQNWGVGFYNAPGGKVIGDVWAMAKAPDPSMSRFPVGTVSAKVLFTEATPEQVPYLRGSVEWTANIHASVECKRDGEPKVGCVRKPAKVRLLQMDIAVRDDRATDTGWVFGTFIYNAPATGEGGWNGLVPVGIAWGSDPGYTPASHASGRTMVEQWMNPSAVLPKRDLGCAGRVNGPVDNPISSCMSCHSTAVAYKKPVPLPKDFDMVPPSCDASPQSQFYFRNVKGDTPFWNDPGLVALDYSLQMQMGIQNFRSQVAKTEGVTVNGVKKPASPPMAPSREQ